MVAANIDLGPWLRKRTSRLMFWAAAARKNCSRTNFILRKRKATQSDLILEFREQCFPLFSLPLCAGESGRVSQVSGALPSRLMNVNGEILILPTIAWPNFHPGDGKRGR